MKNQSKNLLILSILVLSTPLFGQSKANELANKGNQAFENENYTDAIGYYKKAVAFSDGKTEDNYYRLGEAYFYAKKYDLAMNSLNESISYSQGNSFLRTYCLIGQVYIQQKQYELALLEYREVELVALNTIEEFNISPFGNVFDEVEVFDDKHMHELYQSPLHHHIAIAYHGLDYYEDALVYYQTVIKLDPENADAYNGIGWAYYKLGDYKKSLDNYKKSLKKDPGNIYTIYNMVALYHDMEKYDDAAKSLEGMVGIIREDVGDDKEFREEYGKRLKEYKKRVNYDPAYARKGDMHSVTGDVHGEYDNIIKSLQKDIKKKYRKTPSDSVELAVVYNNLGWLYTLDNNYAMAVKYCKKAISYDPYHMFGLYNLATTYHHMGKYDSAVIYFEKATKIEPDNPIIYTDLGVSYNNLDNHEKALECFQKTIELQPRYTAEHHESNLDHPTLDNGELHEDPVHRYNHLQVIRQALAEAYAHIGWLLNEKGENEEVVLDYYGKAIETDPNYILTYKYMRELYGGE